jgi:uncharacterized protein (DUF2147 family)
MSRSKLLLAMASLFLGFGQVCAETANSPTGIWLTQAGDAKVRISHCGAGLCGTIVWLRSRSIRRQENLKSAIKMPIVHCKAPDHWHQYIQRDEITNNKWSGTTYNAADGKSYSSDVIAAGPRKLEVRGCVMSILCGGETWTKIGEMTSAEANN